MIIDTQIKQETTDLLLRVAGVAMRPNYPDQLLVHVTEGDNSVPAVRLVQEPDNEHDPNAILVCQGPEDIALGYIPKEVASQIKAADWNVRSARVLVHSEHSDRPGLELHLVKAAPQQQDDVPNDAA
jgi:hypothetical protein